MYREATMAGTIQGQEACATSPAASFEALPHTTAILWEEPSDDSLDVEIRIKSDSFEFVLPAGTAQFARIEVYDHKGDFVWRTASLNTNRLVWHTRTMAGGSVPAGRYTYRIVQGKRRVKGALTINR